MVVGTHQVWMTVPDYHLLYISNLDYHTDRQMISSQRRFHRLAEIIQRFISIDCDYAVRPFRDNGIFGYLESCAMRGGDVWVTARDNRFANHLFIYNVQIHTLD